MTSTRDLCRRACLGLLVLCTVWLVIENGVLLALLAWTHLRPVLGAGWLLGALALAAAPLAWLAAVGTFAFAARRRTPHGPWAHCAKEADHA